jgi:hypothetical protein
MDRVIQLWQALDPKLKAELLAGRHTEYPALRQLFYDGYGAEAQTWAERVSLGQVTLPGHIWGQA